MHECISQTCIFKQPHPNTICMCIASRSAKLCIFSEEETGIKRMEYFYILIIGIKIVQFDKIVKCQGFSLHSSKANMIITKIHSHECKQGRTTWQLMELHWCLCKLFIYNSMNVCLCLPVQLSSCIFFTGISLYTNTTSLSHKIRC